MSSLKDKPTALLLYGLLACRYPGCTAVFFTKADLQSHIKYHQEQVEWRPTRSRNGEICHQRMLPDLTEQLRINGALTIGGYYYKLIGDYVWRKPAE